MKFRYLPAFGLILVAAMTCSPASADDPLILERSIPIESGGGARLNTVGVILGVDEPGSGLGDGKTTLLFDGFFWTNQDQGAIVNLDGSVDPDFAHVTSVFSNGSNDRVWVGVQWHPGDGFSGGGGPESWFFFEDLAGTSAIDLSNYRISRIQMTLDQFHIGVPGRDPNGDGMWTDVIGQVRFAFFGVVVPEPCSGTLLLVAGAIGSLAVWRRRRVRSN